MFLIQIIKFCLKWLKMLPMRFYGYLLLFAVFLYFFCSYFNLKENNKENEQILKEIEKHNKVVKQQNKKLENFKQVQKNINNKAEQQKNDFEKINKKIEAYNSYFNSSAVDDKLFKQQN